MNINIISILFLLKASFKNFKKVHLKEIKNFTYNVYKLYHMLTYNLIIAEMSDI